MQGQDIVTSKLRRCMWDGPFAMTNENISNMAAQITLGPNQPYMIQANPGATTQIMKLYTPSPANVMWCHEIWNTSTGAGSITVQAAGSATTIGTVAPGKRAEVVWNPNAATPEWSAFLSA